MTELLEFIALSLLPSWCAIRAGDWLRRGDSSRVVLDRLLADHWRDEPTKRAALQQRAAAAVDRAATGEMIAVTWNDPAYPAALTTIPDPPPVLWVRGNVESLRQPLVAIVGARAGSPYALAVAARLAGDLAAAGLVVVSGL